MEQRGLQATIIRNPSNGFHYVALARYPQRDVATAAYRSNLDGRFNAPMWILNVVDESEAVAQTTPPSNYVQSRAVVRKTLSKENSSGLNPGYYLIVNVFSTENYYKKFMDQLKDQGLSPNSFKDPENAMNYVYLKQYNTLNEAQTAVATDLNGAYKEDKWILRVR
ncbi:hypothetical protein P8624_04915 [Flavobacteriaceae bacterium YJPT1-3]|nr:hypothetical protein P8624_04915 [Flavobacteriaceae bacterium YJPT1-3]